MYRFFVFLFLTSYAFGTPYFSRPITEKKELHGDEDLPWFQGSLISPRGHTLVQGEVLVQPMVFASDGMGTYAYIWQNRGTLKTNTVNPVLKVGVGVFDFWDLEFALQGYYKERWGKHSYRRGDFVVGTGFQLWRQERRNAAPDVRFFIYQNFPWGYYKYLNPYKNKTDSSGSGAYETTYGLVIQKTFHISGIHYLNFKSSLGYTFSQRVQVNGFNTYGGGFGTTGEIRPKGKATGIFTLEYSLTKALAFNFDFIGTYSQNIRFRGTVGTDVNGNPARFDLDEIYQFSAAPSLEWSFTNKLSIFTGIWGSLAGQQQDTFFSGIIGMNIRNF